MTSFSQESENLFSQLKYLGLAIEESLAKLQETIGKIYSIAESFRKIHESLNKRLGISNTILESIDESNFINGLKTWINSINIERKIVSEHIAGFFHNRKHDFLELNILLNEKFELSQKIKNELNSLTKQKKKLFDSKSVEKWGINFEKLGADLNLKIKSFSAIQDDMLPIVF